VLIPTHQHLGSGTARERIDHHDAVTSGILMIAASIGCDRDYREKFELTIVMVMSVAAMRPYGRPIVDITYDLG
jgi:hypothetical protein